MDLLLAAEQYAAAQATAVAAAQYYANAANAAFNAAAAGGGVLLSGSQMVGQGQLVAVPSGNTWSTGTAAPPNATKRFAEHDDRDDVEYEEDGSKRRRRSRSRERKKRSRRSRSRSRSWDRKRSRSRTRSRDRRRNRDKSPRRSRQESPSKDFATRMREAHDSSARKTSLQTLFEERFSDKSEDDWRLTPPNNTIMVRGLPQLITEQHIQDNIASHGLAAKDIRLIRKKDTGASRGFAFVEFASTEGASRWIESQQGWLHFEGAKVSMQYSVPRDQRVFDTPKLINDWICAKCGVQNFRRRDVCFKCSGPRTDFDSGQEPYDEVSTHPTNSVLLSGLDALTTEDSVLTILGPLTNIPLKSVRIGRDPLTNTSRGVCYVEMNSVVDSMFLHNQLLANPPLIDGKRVEVGYHKQVGSAQTGSGSTSQNQAAANSALEAAQWTNKSSTGVHVNKFSAAEIERMAEYSANLYAKTTEEKESYTEYYRKFYTDGGDASAAMAGLKELQSGVTGKVVINGVEYNKYKTPDVTTYQYDETSGYYYDPISKLYYDANSQYYFNSKTNKFCYWDAKHETFLPAPDQEKPDDKKKEKEKAKSAKKIQKDMEKWAKKNNQRKEEVRSVNLATKSSVSGSTASSYSGKGAEDVAFNMLQRQEVKDEGGLTGLAGYASDNEEEIEQTSNSNETSVAEFNLTDWQGLACLLCSRKFQTKEKLQKHNTVSDLHRQNLEEWRAKDAGDDQGESQYRDRAKERRTKFGVDDTGPAENKFKDKFMRVVGNMKQSGGSSKPSEQPKIGEDNVGNKMLQKMGWKDGLGLGKANQGRTEIIEAKSRSAQSGLGTKQISTDGSDDYKSIARKTMWSRYDD